MWIKVCSMDGKVSHRVHGLSKLTKIEELRPLLVDKFDAPIERQRLYYRGKQLEDGHSLFDYDVGINDTIQIFVRQLLVDSQEKSAIIEDTNKENHDAEKAQYQNSLEEQVLSKYYEVGDLVDAKDIKQHGSWFEAKIVQIKPQKQVSQCVPECQSTLCQHKINENKFDDGLAYTVVFDDYEDSEGPQDLKLGFLRPRARHLIDYDNIKVGDLVMINYNIDSPTERGYWFDCKVTALKQTKHKKEIIGTLLIGAQETELENCKILFTDEVYAVENNTLLSEQSGKQNEEPVVRSKPEEPKCSRCKDNPARKCRECSCRLCGGKDSPEKQLVCDECGFCFHLWCMDPPLTEIPEEEDWYCPDCKNDETEVVRAGEKLKASKKKSKMPSANSSTSRDWGKGMACVGRTKECTIVPPNHFGPIPGVEVGSMWKFRVQVSESGVHRPPVAGIHGRDKEGAYSIVLSGGYEDDLDEGEEFKYTGSGGRDLSGNKRCAEQSCDQTLTRMNKALALNCNAKLNKDGAEAEDWKGGKPVRVVRNCKGSKHSKYAPTEGNRYDGIYKIVKYWQEKGKSGYLVWRYLLRRDDPIPAPWTKAGKKRSLELGLEMQYPEGYLEKNEKEDEDGTATKTQGKRKHSDLGSDSTKKKRKTIAYSLSSDVENLIKKDSVNKKIWDECLEVVSEGAQEFLKKVESCFSCICCQEVVYNPITTVCSHNICKSCMGRSFKAEVYSCPMCRHDLEKNILKDKNETLQKILSSLFPGYEAGR
ncbi:E3 ubiquitin-protein ligase UHRF1 isoform X2 [Parasteatoda tepidariorum]|nr:E3 ubiquitin-protein ligase UHRF1 isoform X2 [Parasteatoda tepidariorum]